MSTRSITLPMPHNGQRIVRQQARRFNHNCAGRRWRKSTLAMTIIVEAALRGGEYGWTAPSYKQVRIGWDEMRRACTDVVTFNETRLEAHFPNGGRVRFASLSDPDLVRGWTLDGLAMDEASECPERGWYEVLRPMLLDTGGWTWFMYTPKGRNWTWREWTLATTDERPDTMAWQIPTLGARIDNGQLIRQPHPLENPEISWAEMQHMFTTMPERTFRQEILAEFLDDAGGVFRGVSGGIAPDAALLPGPTNKHERYVIGVDLAKHADYTVCVVANLDTRRIVAFDRFNLDSWPLQKSRIYEQAQRWNNALVVMDTTGLGDPIYDDLKAAGLRITPYRFTHASKQDLVENAVLLVEQRQVSYPDIPVLIAELKAYEYQRSPGGAWKMSAPDGMHDDAVIAFCLACWPMGRGARQGPLPTGLSLAEALIHGATPASEIGGVNIFYKQF